MHGMCVSLQKLYVEHSPHRDGVWRRNLWEVIRSWGRRPPGWDRCSCTKRQERWLLSLPYEEDKCLQTRTTLVSRTWPCWHFELRLPASKTVRNKCLVFKPPTLLYSGLRHKVSLTYKFFPLYDSIGELRHSQSLLYTWAVFFFFWGIIWRQGLIFSFF